MSASYRHFTADHQYRGGSGLNESVTRLGTQVISKMRFVSFDAVYAVNEQLNLTLDIPFVAYGSSSRALPASVAGSPRFVHTATGFGDITAGGRYWLMDCATHSRENIGIGVALKMPTGNSAVTDLFPNALGQDIRLRVVDQSIQPGDGGWGFLVTLEAFKSLGDFTLFGSGAYLFNPRGQNDTLSAPAFLNPAGPEAVPADFRYNTVGDSYIARVGLGYPLAALRGVSLSVAGRIEGVPATDILGPTIGFRRPGFFVSVEPGVIYSTQKATFSLSVPLRVYQYVQDSLGAPRDSTFADHLLLASASYRFGGD